MFEELIAEGAAVPLDGWDFSWFEGRATEERPPWGYARLVAERMSKARAALDIQTGGGEVLGSVPQTPELLVATEAWPPNVPVAARNLSGHVVHTAGLPFRDNTFDLVVSRHPVSTDWAGIARVLQPGGTFLSQQIGAGTVKELAEAMAGPQPDNPHRHASAAVAGAEAAGLTVVDLREAKLRMEFYDIAAVVHFLRKVVWIVPGFTVDRYRAQLLAVHHTIEADGRFVAHSRRFLIEARA